MNSRSWFAALYFSTALAVGNWGMGWEADREDYGVAVPFRAYLVGAAFLLFVAAGVLALLRCRLSLKMGVSGFALAAPVWLTSGIGTGWRFTYNLGDRFSAELAILWMILSATFSVAAIYTDRNGQPRSDLRGWRLVAGGRRLLASRPWFAAVYFATGVLMCAWLWRAWLRADFSYYGFSVSAWVYPMAAASGAFALATLLMPFRPRSGVLVALLGCTVAAPACAVVLPWAFQLSPAFSGLRELSAEGSILMVAVSALVSIFAWRRFLHDAAAAPATRIGKT